jgi:hypothetical protein
VTGLAQHAAPAAAPIQPRHAAVVLCLALTARLGLFGVAQPWRPDVVRDALLTPDAWEYHQLAVTLLEHHRFAFTPHGPPDALRTPGYPFFVAALYAACGPRP